MRLVRLEVDRFRGIKRLDWRKIGSCAALVGPGDSGKSTILDAIERLLSPKWNIAFDDTDFWDLDTTQPIVIRGTIHELPELFYRDTKYGLKLHVYDPHLGEAVTPSEDADTRNGALVIELRVDSNLEPSWMVIDGAGQSHQLHARDREEMGMLRVGSTNVDHHLAWGRGSVLTRLTEGMDQVGGVLAHASRLARAGVQHQELGKLSATAARVAEIGRGIGVAPRHSLMPHLDAASLSMASGALSLHDGAVPVRRAGLGTRRLLAVAMQREIGAGSGITLVDEFECGLEPYRIRRLLRVLRGKPPEPALTSAGQLLLTSHSPSVLVELEATEVCATRRATDGSVSVTSLPTAVAYLLPRSPHALFARKVLVAEGATEVGLCRALDEAWSDETGASFGYRGVAVVDGGGSSQPADVAKHLCALGYQVGLFIDSDANAKATRAPAATLLTWPDQTCTEQRLANDLPLPAIREMTVRATETGKGLRSVRDALAPGLDIASTNFPDEPSAWCDLVDEARFRKVLGDTAKQAAHGWFKTHEQGEFLGRLVVKHWDTLAGSKTREVLERLRTFVHE